MKDVVIKKAMEHGDKPKENGEGQAKQAKQCDKNEYFNYFFSSLNVFSKTIVNDYMCVCVCARIVWMCFSVVSVCMCVCVRERNNCYNLQ
uniref:Uncharacterized protein n=1 Tax=Anopheles quadriannulatus TaxID=34691 RepID=A0A182XTV7_ANOQN